MRLPRKEGGFVALPDELSRDLSRGLDRVGVYVGATVEVCLHGGSGKLLEVCLELRRNKKRSVFIWSRPTPVRGIIIGVDVR